MTRTAKFQAVSTQVYKQNSGLAISTQALGCDCLLLSHLVHLQGITSQFTAAMWSPPNWRSMRQYLLCLTASLFYSTTNVNITEKEENQSCTKTVLGNILNDHIVEKRFHSCSVGSFLKSAECCPERAGRLQENASLVRNFWVSLLDRQTIQLIKEY